MLSRRWFWLSLVAVNFFAVAAMGRQVDSDTDDTSTQKQWDGICQDKDHNYQAMLDFLSDHQDELTSKKQGPQDIVLKIYKSDTEALLSGLEQRAEDAQDCTEAESVSSDIQTLLDSHTDFQKDFGKSEGTNVESKALKLYAKLANQMMVAKDEDDSDHGPRKADLDCAKEMYSHALKVKRPYHANAKENAMFASIRNDIKSYRKEIPIRRLEEQATEKGWANNWRLQQNYYSLQSSIYDDYMQTCFGNGTEDGDYSACDAATRRYVSLNDVQGLGQQTDQRIAARQQMRQQMMQQRTQAINGVPLNGVGSGGTPMTTNPGFSGLNNGSTLPQINSQLGQSNGMLNLSTISGSGTNGMQFTRPN